MTLAWDRFEQLAGAEQRNFEVLHRALVRRRWGRYGQLRDRLNQPGIEFHVQLHTECDDLGAPPRWWGWQCKYYKLPASKSLGTTRRDEIADAVKKAREDVPGLTDFVLCLPNLPRKADLDWYDETLQAQAPPGLRLHRWGPDDLEAYIEGGATILRASFFGELVLTDEVLAASHTKSVAPIRKRWVPDLHVVTHAERMLAKALLRFDGSETLARHAQTVRHLAQDLASSHDDLAEDNRAALLRVVAEVEALSDILDGVVASFADHRPEATVELLEQVAPPAMTMREVATALRPVKLLFSPAATAAGTVLADMRRALALVSDIRGLSTYAVLAVVGDAGSGKSHLGAQITAPQEGTPAGVYIRGVELHRGATLDDLASRIPDLGVASFTDLLEACDAVGARNGLRLPVVIDGLNEAHRPEDWSDLLAQLIPSLDQYPNVKVILTYRGALADQLRSDDVGEIELELDDVEISTAVDRYFTHYKIDSGGAFLPFALFRELLFLRLYCEATNPEAANWVGAEALPQSLVDVFARYIAQVADRLSKRPGHPTLAPGYVDAKLHSVALRLWERDARDLPWQETKLLLDGTEGEWEDSLLRALEEEGVLARDDSGGLAERTSGALFDRLGGYLIASALVTSKTPAAVREELSSPDFWGRLGSPTRHPLADDIRACLVGLLPMHNLGQLWKLAPEAGRATALLATLTLESRHIDDDTLDALVSVVGQPVRGYPGTHPFDRLWRLNDAPGHKLNAHFLDRVLRSMAVAERDLVWTEWVRRRSETLANDVEAQRRRWEDDDRRSDADALAGLALAWLQTTSSLPLRDAATRALQRLGQGQPDLIFDLAERLLDVDDPYVVERVVAAAYGAAMTRQMPEPGSPFERALARWLSRLQAAYLGVDAEHPTSHVLLRSYVSGCFELASVLHPAALPTAIDPAALAFAPRATPEPLPDGDARREEVSRTLHMDFSNYTVGGLFEGRANYQMEHVEYVDGMAQVAGRIWELGWREEGFGQLDSQIAEHRWRRHEDANTTERYGKKYGWIAYYELAGRLSDAGQARDERWTRPRDGVWPDIDPTFTPAPSTLDRPLPEWASQSPTDIAEWMANGMVVVPDELLACDTVDGHEGPWVLIDGYAHHENTVRATTVWALMHSALVGVDEYARLVELLQSEEYLGNRLVDHVPEAHSVFAGEIPWSRRWRDATMEGSESVYDARIGHWESGIPIETLAHGYDFSPDRSTTIDASGHRVPSRRLSERFDLRQLPRTLNMVTLDGSLASLTLQAPDGHRGHFLYVRRDLLEGYADGRRLVQVVWGEREHRFERYWDPPEWFREIAQGHRNLWRRVETAF